MSHHEHDAVSGRGLARRLGLFDATMIVMGGIVGSGIFINTYVVARQVHTPALIVGAWLVGGAVALAGAFVYAELAARRPQVGGQYAYLRDAFHPMVAFLYGWTLLLVVQTGGMAASALVFGRYARELTGIAAPEWLWASVTLMTLTLINCVGVKAGSNVQSFFMIVKLLVIATVIVSGLFLFTGIAPVTTAASNEGSGSFGVMTSLVPILFTYGGWQTASFVSGEMRDPQRDLARGLLLGVCGVILLYTLVNVACLRALGAEGLAATKTPATALMRLALGERGARLIAVGIAVSTLGFLSQSMLTAPRVYFAMAEDGLFFRGVARLSERTRAPVAAIALQGFFAAVIAASGRYEQILNYVVSVDFIWFGLTALSLFVFRRSVTGEGAGFRVPGHPFTTALFAAACAIIVAATFYQDPFNSALGLAILATGVPVYFLWSGHRVRE